MSNQIIPFDQVGKVPAYIKNRVAKVDNSALGTVSVSFPVISLKGKRFTVVKNNERQIINDPRTDEPANSIMVAIIRVNPGLSKAFYRDGYVDGTTEKPDCFSSDGVRPDPQARDKQSKTCALCPHNKFGTAVSRDGVGGGKGKACPDTKRLAVAAPDHLDKPMLLRVPPTSLKNLKLLGSALDEYKAPVNYVCTKISFDTDSTHQLLNFKPVGYLQEEAIEQIEAMQDSDIILQITGEANSLDDDDDDDDKPVRKAKVQVEEDDEPPKPKAKAVVVEEDDEPVRKPKARVMDDEDEEQPKPKAKLKVVDDEDDEPAPKAKAKVVDDEDETPKPKKKAVLADDDDLGGALGSFLGAGFDD